MSAEAEAKCIMCKYKMWVPAGSVPNGDMPTCPKCFNIMVSTGKARHER